MTATPAPALTPAEQAAVDRFGIFEPEEREAALVESVARALRVASSHWSGSAEDTYPRLAAAAVAAYRAAQPPNPAEEALRRVEEVAYECGGELSDVDPDDLDDAARAQHLASISLHTKLCLALWGAR